MDHIEKQVRLPFKTSLGITLQGIRIRLGRAIVTISGVVLGIAFLMNILAGALIKDTVAETTALRKKVAFMTKIIHDESGTLGGSKKIALVALGTLKPYEEKLVEGLVKEASAANVRAYGLQKQDLPQSSLEGIGDDAEILLLLGDGKACPVSLDALTAGMRHNVVLDTMTEDSPRSFAAASSSKIRHESFFGKKTAEEIEREKHQAEQDKFRMVWIVSISLLVTVIGISNALLMSVTERFKEIGTMKCLGALSSFIRQLFLIESALIGAAGSILGVLIGILFPLLVYGVINGFGIILVGLNYYQMMIASLSCVVAGTILSIVAAIYPATLASRMVPAAALRSNV